jgi:aminodeoxyfutalosine synthase
VLTGYSLADLLDLAGHDHLVLAELAQALRSEGLQAVAETPIDRLGPAELAVEVIRAVQHGGLATWRLTVDRAPMTDRLDLVMRAVEIQREVGGVEAFAPLPRLDPAELPSTGYDDVRTIAVARIVCQSIGRIQVDWPLYGPKLAQVAIAYGANDIDGIAPVDTAELGPRRAAAEDIARQIRAASGVPVERDGRYQPRA